MITFIFLMQMVGCDSPAADLSSAVTEVLQQGKSLQVLLVCSQVDDARDQTPAGLLAEIEQLNSVQQAVQGVSDNHMVVYTSHTSPLTVARRSMLSYKGFGPYQKCGPLCQVRCATAS